MGKFMVSVKRKQGDILPHRLQVARPADRGLSLQGRCTSVLGGVFSGPPCAFVFFFAALPFACRSRPNNTFLLRGSLVYAAVTHGLISTLGDESLRRPTPRNTLSAGMSLTGIACPCTIHNFSHLVSIAKLSHFQVDTGAVLPADSASVRIWEAHAVTHPDPFRFAGSALLSLIPTRPRSSPAGMLSLNLCADRDFYITSAASQPTSAGAGHTDARTWSHEHDPGLWWPEGRESSFSTTCVWVSHVTHKIAPKKNTILDVFKFLSRSILELTEARVCVCGMRAESEDLMSVIKEGDSPEPLFGAVDNIVILTWVSWMCGEGHATFARGFFSGDTRLPAPCCGGGHLAAMLYPWWPLRSAIASA